MKKVLVACLFVLSAAAAPPPCGAQTEPRPVRFVALGDGGDSSPGKLDVARAVEQVCAARGCDFALYLGDNFYTSGTKGAYDPQFEEKFESPFRNLPFPFYATQGNHDNSSQDVVGGDGHDNRRGDSQVEYHFRRDRLSGRWRMPARFYAVRFGDLHLINLDTNAVMEDGRGTNDPGSARQLAWARAELAASDARWKIVTGHHPYLSNGAHGNAGSYRGLPEVQGSGANFKAFAEQSFCGRADLYFCGHDHQLEWLKPVSACGRTEFIISGAASQPRPLGAKLNEFHFQAGNVLGFWWVEAAGNTLRAVAYDSRGVALFERAVTK